MVFSGFYEQVLLGEICQNITDLGKLSVDVFIVGEKRESGTGFYRDYNSKLKPLEKSTGIYILWMVVSSVLINTRLETLGES